MRQGNGDLCELYTAVAGGPIVILTLDENENENTNRNLFNYLRQNSNALSERAINTFVICPPGLANGIQQEPAAADGAFTVLPDEGGEAASAYLGMAGVSAPAAFVLDPNQRVTGIHTGCDPFCMLGTVTGIVDRHTTDRAVRTIGEIAPVLVIPNVLDAAMIERLKDCWESQGHGDGMIRAGADQGGERHVSHAFKRRSDHVIEDPQLDWDLSDALISRIGQEVARVHYFEDWVFERFRIGCYEAENAGFFAPHRDNYNRDVQNRRFALTINLNCGEYEGGGLRFPEYGPEEFCPPTGGGIVFSCSLLHEVVPVTKGRRFTLLNFLIADPGRSAPA